MQRQKEQEKLMRDYLDHVKNSKTEEGKNLILLPENFESIIEIAIDGQKTQENLVDRGFLTEDQSQTSNFQEIISKIIQEETKDPIKEVVSRVLLINLIRKILTTRKSKR